MMASNDNRRVHRKRNRANAPTSVAKMTRILADIYAQPPSTIVNGQDESLTWLDDEHLVPAAGNRNPVPADPDKR